MRQDALDYRRFEDGGDDLELATAVRAVLDVDLEHALEQPGPADPHWPGVCAAGLARRLLGFTGSLLGAMRHYQCPQLGVRRQHPVEANQMQPRSRLPAQPGAA